MIAFTDQTLVTQVPFPDGVDEQPVPVLVYLSGNSRGTTLRLGGEWLRIGTAPDTEIRIHPLTLPQPAAHHATLVRRGRTYQIVAEPGCDVWVNGEPTRSLALASGDLLEIGRDGTLLRFRLYPSDSPAHKSLPEIFADCVDCARYSGRGPVGRLGLVLGQMPRELALQTSLAFRARVVVVLLALGGVSGYAVLQGSALQSQVGLQASQLGQMGTLLEAARRESLTPEELADILRSAPAEGVVAETVRRMGERLARSDERLTQVVPPGLRPLELRAGSPPPGEEVFVVGYPLGIRAIVARAGTAFMESLRSEGGGSMWEVSQKLADQGLISPLVTRGIVGQVTEEAITYDAQTTSGGSGGPVLDGEGQVVAVNMAILPDFAGSNLGVPGARVREVLTRSVASAR